MARPRPPAVAAARSGTSARRSSAPGTVTRRTSASELRPPDSVSAATGVVLAAETGCRTTGCSAPVVVAATGFCVACAGSGFGFGFGFGFAAAGLGLGLVAGLAVVRLVDDAPEDDDEELEEGRDVVEELVSVDAEVWAGFDVCFGFDVCAGFGVVLVVAGVVSVVVTGVVGGGAGSGAGSSARAIGTITTDTAVSATAMSRRMPPMW